MSIFKQSQRAAILAALASPIIAAQAATTTEWTFVYQNFDITGIDEIGEISTWHDPNRKLSGRFTATDVDRSGAIERAELTGFTLWGGSYLTCYSPYASCSVDAFHFDLGTGLSFRGGSRSSDPEGFYSWTDYARSGHSAGWSSHGPSSHEFETYTWRPDTTLTLTSRVVAMPVPEPSAWLMLGAGVLLLARRARHRA